MTFEEIIIFLEKHGTEQTYKIFNNHGIPDPKFGVKVADLNIVQKAIKKNYELSMKLFETGNYDAMYLAGLIADEKSMTKEDLKHWMSLARSSHIATTTVAWIASESNYGLELAREWILSDDEIVKAGGYGTYTSLISITPNNDLDTQEIEGLLDNIVEIVHDEANDVRYEMNGFVIAAGGYIPTLAEKAKTYGQRIGKIDYKSGKSACKVPSIVPYIEKMEARGVKKRKKARC